MNGQKLSKRNGDVGVDLYKEKGYLPESLINGLALLGWNPPQHEDANVLSGDVNHFLRSEVMHMTEMEKVFNIYKVGKSGVKFEEKKFEYLNQMHIREKFTYYEDLKEKQQCINEWR